MPPSLEQCGHPFHRPLAISVAGLMLAGAGLAVAALVLAITHRETGQALAYPPVAIGLTGVAVMVLRGTRWVIRIIIVVLAGQLAAIAGTIWELSHGIDARKASQLRQLGFDRTTGVVINLSTSLRVRAVLLVRNTLARGAAAPTYARPFGRDWGFRLADVKAPVRCWHGDADPYVSRAAAQTAVSRLPDAQLILCDRVRAISAASPRPTSSSARSSELQRVSAGLPYPGARNGTAAASAVVAPRQPACMASALASTSWSTIGGFSLETVSTGTFDATRRRPRLERRPRQTSGSSSRTLALPTLQGRADVVQEPRI